MSELYNKIETLCKEKGITITTMCRESSISRGSLTDLKSGRIKSLSTDTLRKIAEYFDISSDYLIQDELRKKAIEKFGFCWDYKTREKIKAKSRALINNKSLSDDEIVENAILIFKALFSRSLEQSVYNLNHVDFNTYVSMMLNQMQWKNEYNSTVYAKLVEKYGVSEGIENGTYYNCQQIKVTDNKSKITCTTTIDDIKFALFGDVDVDDDVLDDVKRYAKIARQMREEQKKREK